MEEGMDRLKEIIRHKVIEDIDLSREVTDDELLDTIDRILVNFSKEEDISVQEKCRLRRDIFNSIRRLDILQEFIEDTSITEIMVNGPGNIFIEKNGRIYPSEKHFDSVQKLEDVVQQIVSHSNRIINEACPIVDSRLSDELKKINNNFNAIYTVKLIYR